MATRQFNSNLIESHNRRNEIFRKPANFYVTSTLFERSNQIRRGRYSPGGKSDRSGGDKGFRDENMARKRIKCTGNNC